MRRIAIIACEIAFLTFIPISFLLPAEPLPPVPPTAVDAYAATSVGEGGIVAMLGPSSTPSDLDAEPNTPRQSTCFNMRQFFAQLCKHREPCCRCEYARKLKKCFAKILEAIKNFPSNHQRFYNTPYPNYPFYPDLSDFLDAVEED